MSENSRLTLVLVRHAIAEDRTEFARTGRPDDERPLTDKGRRRMRKAAAGLRVVLPNLDRLLSSPLIRARQTAKIVAAAYEGLSIDELEAAATGDGNDLLDALRRSPEGATIAVVGHEPTHGDWASWLLSGHALDFVSFKKGEACALEFERDIEAGSARLLWKLRPKQLRALGRPGKGS